MEQRMANRIPWQSSDPAAILRVGERSALTLHRYNRDAAQLVRVGLDRNPFAAVLLHRLLLRRHLIAEDLTDTLIDVCLKALADAESQGGVEDAQDLAPLCAALILLGQREQAARALILCRQACPDIEKGIEFSHKLRRLVCVEADSAFLFQIEMLNLFYRTFPLMWNEQILYHYGLELPTGGHCPAALASLIHQAAQDLSYRYLNNLFVLLIDLSPADAGLDPVAVTEQAFSVRSAEIFRALLFCRKNLSAGCGRPDTVVGNPPATLGGPECLVAAVAGMVHAVLCQPQHPPGTEPGRPTAGPVPKTASTSGKNLPKDQSCGPKDPCRFVL